MDRDIIVHIEKLRKEVPEAFGKPAISEDIVKAEKMLGVVFPDDYKLFLSKFGSGGVGKAIILGLSEAEFLPTPSIIDITLEFRQEYPELRGFIVIGIDGAGNPIGFMPDNPTVFTIDHNFGGRYDLATDFNDYVRKALNRTLQASF